VIGVYNGPDIGGLSHVNSLNLVRVGRLAMAKKRQVDDRDVLKFKLQALHEYISHHERKLDQFHIDLQKAALFRETRDPDDFIGRVTSILSDLYTADPPLSLIEADLTDARKEVNHAYNTSPEWAEIRGKVIESGLAERPIEARFDLVLAHTMMSVFGRLKALQTSGASTGDRNDLAGELIAIMEYARIVFDWALDPARHLRQRWIDAMKGPTSARPGSRGRPKDETVARRNPKIIEAWKTGNYRTYKELGDAFGVTAEVARKVVRSIRRKPKTGSEDTKKPVK